MNMNMITDQEMSNWEEKAKSMKKVAIQVPMEPLQQIDLGYEDRCLIRMNALSKAMSLKENGKKAKEKFDKLKLWQKIIYFAFLFVIIVMIIVFIAMFNYTTNKRNILYLWLLFIIIALCIFFTF